MIPKMKHSTIAETKERIKKYHREMTMEEFQKIAKESMKCPVCAGRPLLHMRMCMQYGDSRMMRMKLRKCV